LCGVCVCVRLGLLAVLMSHSGVWCRWFCLTVSYWLASLKFDPFNQKQSVSATNTHTRQ
jgi:hypothetical protein